MMTPLGDVARVSTSYPFRKKVMPELGGDIVLVQLKHLDGTEGLSSTGTVALSNDSGKYTRYLLETDDLLFQSRGSRHPVVVFESSVRSIAGSGLHVIRVKPAWMNPRFIAWWLNHPISQAKFVGEVARGTYIPFVSKADLEQFLVPLVPLEHQAQIVAVDTLAQRESALRAHLEVLTTQLTNAATYRAATRSFPRNADNE